MNTKELRKNFGDTQSDFSMRYGIPFRTIQNWETGKRKPPKYVEKLLEGRINRDLYNRKTIVLPCRKKVIPQVYLQKLKNLLY